MASSSRAPDQEGHVVKVTDELSPTDGAASIALMRALGEPAVSEAMTDEDMAAIMSLVEEQEAIIAMAEMNLQPPRMELTRTAHSETYETAEFFLPFDDPNQSVFPSLREQDGGETLTTDGRASCYYPWCINVSRVIPKNEVFATCTLEPLEKKGSLECIPVIINGVGTLEKVCQNGAVYLVIVLKFAPLKVLVRKNSFYVDGHLTMTGLESFIGREVHFNASSPGNLIHLSGATYEAHFSWLGEKPSTSVFLDSYKVLGQRVVSLNPSSIYIGIVCSNPQPDHCIVSFHHGVIYVSNKCLLVDPWTRDTCDVAVSDYLKPGDRVAFTVKSENRLEADMCGTLPDISTRIIQKIMLDDRGQSEKRKQIGGLESSLTDMLFCEKEYLDINVPYRGVVVYLFSQQDAIALVGVIRVLINIGELIKSEYKGDDDDVIGEHLEIGTPVLLRVQPQTSFDSVYYCATEARIISDSNEAIILRNQKGSIVKVCDESQLCSVAWTHGSERRMVGCAFYLLRSKAALAEYTRCNSIISCRTLKERLVCGADVSVTEIVSSDELVPDVVWFSD